MPVEIRGNPRTSHVFVTRNDGSGHATYNDQEVVHSKSIVQYVVEFFRGPFVEDHSSMEIEGASSSYSFRTTNRGDGNVTKNG
ncbi:hypothetical protein VNI00_009438 [Paramarasmius palmivorus]|uniref:Uncharacterized protein n=1 Tax=Paramarasmius palmivorus TaxID=297713 RepID=A0AAW0CRS0_9AGAR